MSTPQREFALDVVRRLRAAGYEALWAGGCVRDMLLGLAPDDYDVATSARPEQVRDLFGPRRTIPVGESFGVIIVKGPRDAGTIEVATFRTEGPYIDGRRPSSVAFCTPAEDAQRRDFTINGMFYDPLDEQIHDYVDGQSDLTNGIVRAIGDPFSRFIEDKLRMLRAVRMTARFRFSLDEPTALAIRQMAGEILVVSQERIAQELKKMLVHAERRRALELAADAALLPIVLPELAPFIPDIEEEAVDTPNRQSWDLLLRRLELLRSPSFELALAVTLSVSAEQRPREVADLVSTCCRRLKLSNKELEQTQWLLENRDSLRNAEQQPVAQLKRLLIHPQISDLLAFARANAEAANAPFTDIEWVEQFLRDTPPEILNPPPLLTGDDLIRQGFRPGPNFKSILDKVRDAQLEGRVQTRDEALALAEKLRDE